MNKTALIIQREYLSRVRKKSFIIMTFLGPLLIGGLLTAAVFIGMSDTEHYNVLVTDLTGQVATDSAGEHTSMFYNQFEETAQMSFDYTDQGLDNQAFQQTDYDLMLVLRPDIFTVPQAEIVFKKLPGMAARSYIKEQAEKVIELAKLRLHDIDRQTYDSIRTNLEIISVDAQDGSVSFKQEQAVIGFIFAVLIYLFIFMYGVQVMRGVMEEKSNRIVEVIISSVKPFQLMMGKILGVALVGLTQFLLWVILTFTVVTVLQSTLFPQYADAGAMMSQVQMTPQVAEQMQQADRVQQAAANEIFELVFFRINWGLMIGMFIFFFLGGYLLYSSLFAAIGAAVDNDTDTQQFMLPITIPLVFGFIVSEFAITNPEGQAVFWFSQIPLTSPVVMMVRVAIGFDAGTVWQLLLSMTLLILGFLFTVWLAAKIYRTGILMYGKKVSYKELWKWLTFKS